MPVTILNPYRSEPWANAVQGLSGALEAFQRYKTDEREYKLRVEEATRRREESEQLRKMRDQDMAIRDQQLQKQAEEENIQKETEREALGENRGIAEGVSNLGDLIKETTSTGFVAPKVDTSAGLGVGTLGQKQKKELAGPPAELAGEAPAVNPFAAPAISALGEKPQMAPLEAMVAPQLTEKPKAEALAARQATTGAAFAIPTGPMTPRERAQGREAIVDKAARKEATKQEAADRLRDTMEIPSDITVMGKTYKAGERVPKVYWELEQQRMRDESADKRATARDEAIAKRQESANEAAFKRAELAAKKAQTAQNEKDEKAKFNQEKVIRDSYDKNAKPYKTAIDQMDKYLGETQAKRRAGQSLSAAEQYGLIYAFNKALDPSSVVRESEFANTQKVAAGYIDRAYQFYKQAARGEMLTDRQIAEMSEVIVNSRAKTQSKLEEENARFASMAANYGLNPENIFGAGASAQIQAKTNPEDPGGLGNVGGKPSAGNPEGLRKPPARRP